MMVHGLSSLARMEDDHLDAMDPYQRDAHGISKLSLDIQNNFIT
jgi:hypothetical protein